MDGPGIMSIDLGEPITRSSAFESPSTHVPMSTALREGDERHANHMPALNGAPSKFLSFPDNVINQILWIVDSNTFASLCYLNQQWYREAQNVELYAYHLSRCPSYALGNPLITGPFRKGDLKRIKAKFAQEVRRNLFDAFTRPRRTLINLISITTSSSAAFPGGEAFKFEFSPNGRTVLALSTSRIYIIDATTESVTVRRELKTLRRPLSASITDDGTLLAVLSSKYQANVYAVPSTGNIKHLQAIALEHSPRTIAIAHEGTVLAAAYETGIEVFSLAVNALSTDRRAVRSEAVDTLNFSGDGSMLVGSSLDLEEPNAVVISAPFYTENDPDLTEREVHSRMWTTQILFPQISSVCSHVALLSGHTEGDATWLFAYDHSLLSYRAVRTDDTRAGVAYFASPSTGNRFSMPSPTVAPSASVCGTLAVAGFGGLGLCLYGIPEKLDITPDMGAVIERHELRHGAMAPLTTATGYFEPLMAYSPSVSGTGESIEDDALASKVDWRQSVFVKCRSIDSLHGHSAAKWVEKPESESCGFHGKRLLVVAPGGVGMSSVGIGDEEMPVDGSRLCLLDFDYMPGKAEDREITIEVGDGQAELLIEQTGSIATEVAMERRRTIRGMPGAENSRMLLGRSVTSLSPPMLSMATADKRGSVSQPSSPVDVPVSPRPASVVGVQRAATAVGYRNALYPPRPPVGSSQGNRPNALGGRRSSQDSWETPPPPYSSGSGGNGSAIGPNLHAPLTVPNLTGISSPTSSERSTQQNSYVPYRALHPGPRASTGMDGMPITDTGPSRRTMSQYGALRIRRKDPSLTSLDTVSETPISRHAVRSAHLTISSATDTGSDMIDSYLNRPRPLTTHGYSADSISGGQRIVSPVSSDNEYRSLLNHEDLPDRQKHLSLTGANLQNRLNHPVPPVPQGNAAVSLSHDVQQPSGFHSSGPMAPKQSDSPSHNPFPAAPTPDQMARLNSRLNQIQPVPAQPAQIPTIHEYEDPISPPSPPPGAWGAVNNHSQARPFANQQTNTRPMTDFPSRKPVPNSSLGAGRSTSSEMPLSPPSTNPYSYGAYNPRNSPHASSSTPNLLAQPTHGRTDMTGSVGPSMNYESLNNGITHSYTQPAPIPNSPPNNSTRRLTRRMSRRSRMSRTQSLMSPSGRPPPGMNGEQSAYQETRRTGPTTLSAALAARDRPKKKRNKGEGSTITALSRREGGGRKCIVM